METQGRTAHEHPARGAPLRRVAAASVAVIVVLAVAGVLLLGQRWNDGSGDVIPISRAPEESPTGPTGQMLVSGPGGDLWSIRADGSDPRQLVPRDAQGLGCEKACETFYDVSLFRHRAWSPDGSRFAFAGPNPSGRSAWLFVVNGDGSDLRRLGPCPAPGPSDCDMPEGSSLSWSPDGTQLALSDEGGIYVVDVATGDARRVQLGRSPSWSQDGWIAYFQTGTSKRARTPETGLYIVRPDGSGNRLLAAQRDPSGQPRWSPDSSRILFEGPGGIQIVNADGSARRRLVSLEKGEGRGGATWSPDGERVAYVRMKSASPYLGRPEVWTVAVDGEDAKRLLAGDCCTYKAAPPRPVWSPDGRVLAFSLRFDSWTAKSGLYLADQDGTSVRRVFAWGDDPMWRPEPS